MNKPQHTVTWSNLTSIILYNRNQNVHIIWFHLCKETCLFRSFAHFWIICIFFFTIELCEFNVYFGYQFLMQYIFVNIFFYSIGCLFLLLVVFFAVQNFFCLVLIYFCFCCLCLCWAESHSVVSNSLWPRGL